MYFIKNTLNFFIVVRVESLQTFSKIKRFRELF